MMIKSSMMDVMIEGYREDIHMDIQSALRGGNAMMMLKELEQFMVVLIHWNVLPLLSSTITQLQQQQQQQAALLGCFSAFDVQCIER